MQPTQLLSNGVIGYLYQFTTTTFKDRHDWWGWDAGTAMADTAHHCAEQTYARGLRIYTWNQDTRVCYFKAPPASGVTMRLSQSQVTYTTDFYKAFDVFHIPDINEQTCAFYCRMGGYRPEDIPPCMVSVHAGGSCYLKFPQRSGFPLYSGMIPEKYEWVFDRP
ncbi:UNVERIFIED_CONTAM: hypothetical protein HDU68_002919 [Siphonaria sp. JEL0065]|nr:hypothetical protein HDU68_002919 [Siphonaria sp. JEL0065]